MQMARPRGSLALVLMIAGLGMLALALWPAAPAGAQAPAPTPCTGVLIKDATGDEETGPDSLNGGSPLNTVGGAAHLDITNFWFNFAPGADGKPVLTANIQVRDLTSMEVPEGSYEGAQEWIASFDTFEGVNWLRAVSDGETVTYEWGATLIADPVVGVTFVTEPQETTGRVFPGPNGVVQIDMPASVPVKVGDTVAGAYAMTGMWAPTLEGYAGFFYSDGAPDDTFEGAKDYKVKECAPAPGGGGGGTPPGGDTPPANNPPQGGQPNAGSTTLPLKVAKALGSAKKAAKRRTLALKVSSTEEIRNLVVQLRKGSKVLGSGRLASLNGKRTLKLRLKSRRLKAGKYTIAATGTVDGRSLSASQTVSLKK